jgi:ubiquinone/menaquinone biosynthesis C-methylase UbiE
MCSIPPKRSTWSTTLHAVTIGIVLLAGCSRDRPVAAGPAVPHGFITARPVAPLFDPGLASTRLETAERDRWQQPARIVDTLHLETGETVADIGSGSGYLLPYLSRAVGRDGIVVAEEIQDGFLPALRKRAKRLPNVRVVLGTPGDPQLPSRKVGVFVLLTVYHEVDHPVDFLSTLRKYGRPDARLAIIDFDANRKGDPPAPDGHQVAEAAVIQEAQAAGWELAERHEFISSQFFLIFRQKR